jgi:hypothetical protein
MADQEDIQAFSDGIDGGREARWTTANDDQIVHRTTSLFVVSSHHCCTTDKHTEDQESGAVINDIKYSRQKSSVRSDRLGASLGRE